MKRRAALFLVLAAGGVAGAPAAAALPFDRALTVARSELHFEKLRYGLGAEVVPADLASAELLPAGEVFVTPLREGIGTLFLYQVGQVEAVRLEIGPATQAAAPALEVTLVQKACPNAELRVVDDETFLHATVDGQACRAALGLALREGTLRADHLRLHFTVGGLQAQLGQLQARLVEAGLADRVSLAYTGATLTLTSPPGTTLDPASHLRLLRTLWPEVLGRMGLDDQLDLRALPETPK